jgi:hypothetical protein
MSSTSGIEPRTGTEGVCVVVDRAGNAGSISERVSVVAELVDAFTAENAGCLPADVTPAERWAAGPLIGARLTAACRPTREAALILFAAYRAGDDWAAVFDRLSPVTAHPFGRPGAARRHRGATQQGRPAVTVWHWGGSAAGDGAVIVSLDRRRTSGALEPGPEGNRR